MKKIKFVRASDTQPLIVEGWQTDTPGLVAWNHPGKLFTDNAAYNVKVQWQLMQVAEYPWIGRVGYHLTSTYKRDECAEIAAVLRDLGDWTLPFNELGAIMLTDAVLSIRAWWQWQMNGREVA